MTRGDVDRQRRLLAYRPLDSTREERAMKYHKRIQREWAATGRHLSDVTGRDPSTLSMFSDDSARTVSEERSLVDHAANGMCKEDLGVWRTIPRIDRKSVV
jgi:hypothetical protein